MRHMVWIGISLAAFATAAAGHPPPLLPEASVAALGDELSGETAKGIWKALQGSIGSAGLEAFTRPPSWWPNGRAPTD